MTRICIGIFVAHIFWAVRGPLILLNALYVFIFSVNLPGYFFDYFLSVFPDSWLFVDSNLFAVECKHISFWHSFQCSKQYVFCVCPWSNFYTNDIGKVRVAVASDYGVSAFSSNVLYLDILFETLGTCYLWQNVISRIKLIYERMYLYVT